MNCPHCASATTKEQTRKTALGYRTFRCSDCKQAFNERTGTPFNFLESPTDIVLLVVLWRLRYKLSLRDLSEMFLERGWEFTHEAVREWEARFAPLMAEHLREMRQFFRFRTTMKQHVSLADQRRLFCQRLDTLRATSTIA